MKASLADCLERLPLAANEQWPNGYPAAEAMAHGTMMLEVFAPRGEDRQTPHRQDELYIVAGGTSDFVNEGETVSVKAGDALFVRAGAEHRFVGMSEDFVTWVVFWGPEGGEAPAPVPSEDASADA